MRRAGLPDQLDTDNGNEWRGAFDNYLQEEDIRREVSDARNKNARATLDSAIKSLRQQLARIQIAEHRRDWASLLQRAARAYNNTEHAGLIGRTPNEVHGDLDLQFNLRQKAADDIAYNTQLIENRGAGLMRAGAFRVEEPIRNKFERSFTPRFGDAIRQVQKVVGSTVYDSEGNAYPTRHVLPVKQGSANVNTHGMHGGSERIDRVRLQALEPYRQRIQDFVGHTGKTENEVTRFMKGLGMATLMHAGFNYRKALVLLGYNVGQGRGSSTALVTKQEVAHAAAAPHSVQAAAAAPPPVDIPPAAPAAILRRRIVGKRTPLAP